MAKYNSIYECIKKNREDERKYIKSHLEQSHINLKQSIDRLDNIDVIINDTVSFLINLKQKSK